MKIDGYEKPDPKVALEQGVTFEYPTNYGNVVIRSKLAGKDNVKFRLAISDYESWSARRRNLNKGKAADDEANKKLIGIFYDHLVISWSTTMKSEGKDIAPTRDNFIELMNSTVGDRVLKVYMEDAQDEDLFRPVTEEEELGNSQKPSAGPFSGEDRSNSSET